MSIETEAWALVPGHDDAGRIRSAAGITSLPREGLPAVSYEPTEHILQAAMEKEVRRLLLAGEPVPSEIAEPVLVAQHADALGRLRAAAMRKVVRSASDRTLQPTDIDSALDHLRALLMDVTRDVAAVLPVVQNLNSADDAIRAEAVDEWRQLGEHAERYEEIRRAQRSLYSTVMRNTTHPFKSDEFERSALFADALDWHPAWTVRRTEPARTEGGSGPLPQAVRDYQAWLRTDLYESDVLNGLVPRERRLVLAVAQHRPWVPTVSQWLAVDDLLQTTTTTPTQGSIAQLETSRQEALRILADDRKLPDPTRLPFYDQSAQRRHTNVAVAGLSVDQLRDIQSSRRSQEQVQEFLADRQKQGGIPAE